MLVLLVGAYVMFSAVLGWRLVTVVTTSMDSKQRADAIRMFSYIWGGGALGGGLAAVAVHMHQSGMLT